MPPMPPLKQGRFIAFCGGEGGGKSTQIRLLAEHLLRHGVPAVITREPGGTPGGAQLRQLLLTASGGNWEPEAEALLMVADRVQHLAQVIRPALDAGSHVLTDRYAYSTFAYQGAGKGVAMPFLQALHRDACGDFWPDLTFILDLDPEKGVARSKRRLVVEASTEDRFEKLSLDFHSRVRAEFRRLAEFGPAPAIVIDAGRTIAEVAAEIRAHADHLLGLPPS